VKPHANVIVTCEHGGNQVPRAYRGLFAGARSLLHGHRGYDPGALALALTLAKALRAPLYTHKVSRLVIDLNRSLEHPRLFSAFTRALDAELRDELIETFYVPHRTAVSNAVAKACRRSQVVHLASHSFTPTLDGHERSADFALLYDPARPAEAAFCSAVKKDLRSRAPSLVVRRNYPYRGTSDGLTTALRRVHDDDHYLGIELELNQKHTRVPATFGRLQRVLAAAFREVLLGKKSQQ
jgi:predicted N-formylglutamate amidohydrolase